MALPFAGHPVPDKEKTGPGFKKVANSLTSRRPLPAGVNGLGKAATMRANPKPGITPRLPQRVPRPMLPGRLNFPGRAAPTAGQLPEGC